MPATAPAAVAPATPRPDWANTRVGRQHRLARGQRLGLIRRNVPIRPSRQLCHSPHMKFCRGKKQPNQEATGKSPGWCPQISLKRVARGDQGKSTRLPSSRLNSTERGVPSSGLQNSNCNEKTRPNRQGDDPPRELSRLNEIVESRCRRLLPNQLQSSGRNETII